MRQKVGAESRAAAASSTLSNLKSKSHPVERMQSRNEISLPDRLLYSAFGGKGKSCSCMALCCFH
jgi:hypothetical protein